MAPRRDRGTREISLAEARRIAIAAQGLDRPHPAGRVGVAQFRRVLNRTQVVQLDSVNVLARAHYLPFFARLGPYDVATLDRWLWRSGEVFEYWGHEASLLPTSHRPLFAHRMNGATRGEYLFQWGRDHAEMVEQVLQEVRARGPLSVAQVEAHEPRLGSWWQWSEAKLALEYLFLAGRIAVYDRVHFSRRYAAPEHVHTTELLAAPPLEPTEAYRRLLVLAATALGVGTAHDLVDYFRLPYTASRHLLRQLAAEGALEAVRVEGWQEPAYLDPSARRPRRVAARALLAPFDPLVWYRDRLERLFGFRYRIEIYTPAPKRVYGYYVLPFLLGDQLVARVDLKADRRAGALLARQVTLEAGADPEATATGLAAELTSMARWLGLERVDATGAGPALADALRTAQ